LFFLLLPKRNILFFIFFTYYFFSEKGEKNKNTEKVADENNLGELGENKNLSAVKKIFFKKKNESLTTNPLTLTKEKSTNLYYRSTHCTNYCSSNQTNRTSGSRTWSWSSNCSRSRPYSSSCNCISTY
jgi:hypothetical protein